MAPSSPILKPVGIGFTMCRMTVLLLEQVGEDNYENRLIYITITIQQFLDLGGGLQFMLTFPTFRLNWKHDEPSVCTLFNFELGVPGCVEEMEAGILLSSWPTRLTLKTAPTGMWRSERVCQSQTSWFCMHQSLFGVSGPSELELTALQYEFGSSKGFK